MASLEKSSGKKLPLTQALAQVISDYNKCVSVRRWKVDTMKKRVITSLLKCPAAILDQLSVHYDQHKHSQSGEPALLIALRRFSTCTEPKASKLNLVENWFTFCLAGLFLPFSALCAAVLI